MQSKRILFLALLAFTIGTEGLFANYAFKKKVKSVCKSYRVTVESSQLSLDIDEFSMTLQSNRNNFEMVMLVGFASAGQAIAHQKQLGLANAYTPPMVIISVEAPVSKGEKNIFMASCTAEQAISLAEGRMDSSQFMQEIMKNMEII
tara:strand:- start:1249 stop:1689 length:441 start_codon:yes stop_codon:yes gene_type:complete